ncbi:hypothetical protein Lal_00015810 [Lupinus albus]|nr:hypothetical protein Lal_00015810 [Lupinus albus]
MSVAAKSLIERFDEKGLPTGKEAAIFNNGESSFSHTDCWNHMRNLRIKNLDVGDAQAVFHYCKLKESKNPNFFYAIQLDDDSRMNYDIAFACGILDKSFLQEWEHIKNDYELEDNEWLNGLYKIRESWVPIYNRSTFFVGMNTTQRSESINSLFDSFVHATTTLHEFVIKFDKAVDSRLEAERREDYESRHKHRILSTGSKLKEHAASINTRNIFGKFQDELGKINQFIKVKIRRDGPRHILIIFQAKGVVQIPDHFILKRWTKEANKGIEASYTENKFDAQFTTSKILRMVHAQQQASILVDLAEESEEMYKFIISDLSNTHKSPIIMKTSSLIVLESSHTIVNETIIPEEITEAPKLIIGDPHISCIKGRRKDGEKMTQNCRFKSGLEVSLLKSSIKRKKCTKSGEHGHNKKNL